MRQPVPVHADDSLLHALLPAVLPANTAMGGPQLPQLAGGKKEAALARHPLVDVTRHYEASSSSICIGAMGGGFGIMPAAVAIGVPATSCRQEAAAAQEAHALAAAAARTAAHKRQALRTMR